MSDRRDTTTAASDGDVPEGAAPAQELVDLLRQLADDADRLLAVARPSGDVYVEGTRFAYWQARANLNDTIKTVRAAL